MSMAIEPFPDCSGGPALHNDVAWLLHRAAHRVRREWDAVAHEHGLRDMREWIVLTAIGEGKKRTQLAIGQRLGLDKTTLTSILDRLEKGGFIVRTLDPNDRRARVPELTEAGLKVWRQVSDIRHEIDERVLGEFSAAERHKFLGVLGQLAGVGEADEPIEQVHGSCMR